MSKGSNVFQMEVWYSGRVQGVGFRYSVLQVAREFELSGMVRNLPDGRVHLCAEGEEGEVRSFATEVARRMEGYVREIEERTGEGVRRYKGFRMEH